MALSEFIDSIKSGKKAVTAVTVLGAAGLCLILLSSILPSGKDSDEKPEPAAVCEASGDFCTETENRLADFLRDIEGVGEVRVYLKVNGNEEYVYATEGRTSISENKTEEEEKYVMIGSSGEKSALVETVKAPGISGAVIACTGCGSAAVQENVYKAASAALGIPTSQIYVTKLKAD